MFPIFSNVTLIHDFNFSKNYNYIFSKDFNSIRNSQTIYSTHSISDYLKETSTTINDFLRELQSNKSEIDLVCDSESFSIILTTFLESILDNKSEENILFFKENYVLDLKFKTIATSRFNQDQHSSKLEEFENTLLKQHTALGKIEVDYKALPFMFLLANWILDKSYHDEVIGYVKFFCWNLLMGEYEVFIKDICIDYYSRNKVIPKEKEHILFDSRLRHQLKYTDDIDNYINYFKEVFNVDEAKSLIHNYFKNTRDTSYIESYDEPVEMIYSDQYETLLIRDIEGPFKIVYATDELWNFHVTTLLSYIYNSYRSNQTDNLERFILC